MKIRNGFTLVELLIVMAIIAILAGFATNKLGESKLAAQLTAMKNDAIHAIAAAEAYYAEYQEYPATINVRYNTTNKGLIEKNGFYTTLTKGNNLWLYREYCSDGSDGYIFKISSNNSRVKKYISFNSCLDASIRVVED